MHQEAPKRKKWTKAEDKLLIEIMKTPGMEQDWKGVQEEMAKQGISKTLKQLKVR